MERSIWGSSSPLNGDRLVRRRGEVLEQWSPAHHHYCMLISSASAPPVGAAESSGRQGSHRLQGTSHFQAKRRVRKLTHSIAVGTLPLLIWACRLSYAETDLCGLRSSACACKMSWLYWSVFKWIEWNNRPLWCNMVYMCGNVIKKISRISLEILDSGSVI